MNISSEAPKNLKSGAVRNQKIIDPKTGKNKIPILNLSAILFLCLITRYKFTPNNNMAVKR